MPNPWIPNLYEAVNWIALDPNTQDGFLLNPPSHPKQEIGHYVASNWILTPQIFDNLSDARRSGKDFIVRSEHEVEYHGAAGLFESLVNSKRAREYSDYLAEWFRNNPIDRESVDFLDSSKMHDLRKVLLQQINDIPQEEFESTMQKLETYTINKYAWLLWIDPISFGSQLWYSYREMIDWYNRSMVEDNAVPGRYHIFTTKNTPSGEYLNYSIIEPSGEVTNLWPHTLVDELKPQTENDVAFYEQVRSLPIFDQNHCPIIEYQTSENENYFLQTHRTRDKNPSTFQLEPKNNPTILNALFCRWATPPEWVILNAEVYCENHFIKPILVVPKKEDAAFDLHDNHIFTEIMTRRRKVQFYNNLHGVGNFATNALIGHIPKSMIFNPALCIVLDEKEVKHSQQLYDRYKQNNFELSLPIHVVSDGTNATVEFYI